MTPRGSTYPKALPFRKKPVEQPNIIIGLIVHHTFLLEPRMYAQGTGAHAVSLTFGGNGNREEREALARDAPKHCASRQAAACTLIPSSGMPTAEGDLKTVHVAPKSVGVAADAGQGDGEEAFSSGATGEGSKEDPTRAGYAPGFLRVDEADVEAAHGREKPEVKAAAKPVLKFSVLAQVFRDRSSRTTYRLCWQGFDLADISSCVGLMVSIVHLLQSPDGAAISGAAGVLSTRPFVASHLRAYHSMTRIPTRAHRVHASPFTLFSPDRTPKRRPTRVHEVGNTALARACLS